MIIEFGDYQCPWCRRVHGPLRAVQRSFPESVAVVYRHFPLSSHTRAYWAARVAECGAIQGKFEGIHDVLYRAIDLVTLEAGQKSGVEPSDSAGVTIASSPTPRFPSGHWRLAQEPDLVLGAVSGPPEQLFTNVVAGFQLENGSIAVALNDRSSSEIRLFDPHGTFMGSASRKGEGPGEFTTLSLIVPHPGDSILALGQDLRFAVFSRTGGLGRAGRVTVPLSPRPESAAGSGRVLVNRPMPDPSFRGEGLKSERTEFLVLEMEGESPQSIATLATYQSYVFSGTHFQVRPFSRYAVGASSVQRVWLARTDVPEVRGYGLDGTLLTLIRGSWPGVEITSEDRERYFELEPAARARLRDGSFPPEFPVMENLEVDREGNVWVLRYEPPWSTRDHQRWDVFSQLGVWLTTVRVPLSVEGTSGCARRAFARCDFILDIGDDYLLVVAKGDYGVPLLRRYRLIKGG